MKDKILNQFIFNFFKKFTNHGFRFAQLVQEL